MNQSITLRNIPTEKELRVIIVKLNAIFFMLGLVAESLIFPRVEHWLLFWIHLLADLMLPAVYLMFRRGWIDDNCALIVQVLAISAAQYADMITYIVVPAPNTDVVLMASMCIMIVPIATAGMTAWKPLSLILAGICMAIYGIGAFSLDNKPLINIFISMACLLIGIAVLQRALMNAWRNADRARERAAEQNAIISRFFNVTSKDFELITKGKMTRQRAAELLERSENVASTALIDRIKDVIHTEEAIKGAIRTAHSGLTDKDLQLCCHIAEGLSASEIAHVTSKAVSSVTARRSRLRAKLGLKAGESLRDYVVMLVNGQPV